MSFAGEWHSCLYISVWYNRSPCDVAEMIQSLHSWVTHDVDTTDLAKPLYTLFTLRKAHAPLILNGKRAFLRVDGDIFLHILTSVSDMYILIHFALGLLLIQQL